jgi:hypothetical protein
MIDPSGTIYRVDMSVKMLSTETAEVVWLEDKSLQSKPGDKLGHIQLLKNLVTSLAFPTPPAFAETDEPPKLPLPKPKAKKQPKKTKESTPNPPAPVAPKPPTIY